MSAPDRIWAWKLNWIGRDNGKQFWSDFKPSFSNLRLRSYKTWWHLWGPMEEVPQSVSEYTRTDLIQPQIDAAVKAALTRQSAAKLLLDMLLCKNGAHEGMTKEQVTRIAVEVEAEEGHDAVLAFLTILAEEGPARAGKGE